MSPARYVADNMRLLFAREAGLTTHGTAPVRCHWCATPGVIQWHPPGRRPTRFAVNCTLEFDHLVPYSKGGRNTRDNLVLACPSCNASRGNRYDTPPRLDARRRAAREQETA